MADYESIREAQGRLAVVFVDAVYARLARSVARKVKRLPDNCRLSGDDSRLRDVWEEFKYQIQYEQSPWFEAYAATIQQICHQVVRRLPVAQQQLLWLWTDEFSDHWADEETATLDKWTPEGICQELYQRVEALAGSEPLAVDPDDETSDEDSDERDEADDE